MKLRSMQDGEKQNDLLGSVTEKLDQTGEASTRLGSILEELLKHFDCSAGTVHLLAASGFLELAAQRGLPEFVVDKIKIIPGQFYLNAHKNLSYYQQIVVPGKAAAQFVIISVGVLPIDAPLGGG